MENDKHVKKFRFYQEFYYEKNGQKCEVETKNASPWIFCGERIDLVIAKIILGTNPKYEVFLKNIENNKFKICYTQTNEMLVMEDADLTYGEYLEKYNDDIKKGEMIRQRLGLGNVSSSKKR